jgi:hypothetical protein
VQRLQHAAETTYKHRTTDIVHEDSYGLLREAPYDQILIRFVRAESNGETRRKTKTIDATIAARITSQS